MKPLVLETINQFSILIIWLPPKQDTDCYIIESYTVTCENTQKTDQNDTQTVKPHEKSREYHVVLTDLEPDSRYNCSVTISYEDLFNETVDLNIPPAFDIKDTYPSLPSINQTLDLVVVGNVHPGTANVDLTGFWNTFTGEDVGYVLVIVLRLGDSSTLNVPTQSIDKQYPNIEDFSTYEEVHSERRTLGYEPYIAAKIYSMDLPEIFSLGSESVVDEEHDTDMYTNGPLDIGDYYAVFIRVYTHSQFGEQDIVFVSSNFSVPFQSMEVSSTTDTMRSTSHATSHGTMQSSNNVTMESPKNGTTERTVIVVVIVVVVTIVAVVTAGLVFFIHSRYHSLSLL